MFIKRVRFIILAVVAVIITSAICYIVIRKDHLTYIYMLYDHIQYEGNDYYHAKDQHYTPSSEGENRGPVYLVNKSSKTISKNTYDTYVFTGYSGDEEEIYLYFDSALWIRGDYTGPPTATGKYYYTIEIGGYDDY